MTTDKEIYDLLMELGSHLADKDFYWPQDLKERFNKATKIKPLKFVRKYEASFGKIEPIEIPASTKILISQDKKSVPPEFDTTKAWTTGMDKNIALKQSIHKIADILKYLVTEGADDPTIDVNIPKKSSI